MKLEARTLELAGTNYEIGKRLGQIMEESPLLKAHHSGGMDGFGEQETKDAIKIFDRWCPGLSEELQGFADELEIPVQKAVYYGMTYLMPRCTQIALSGEMTRHGRPLVARSYEFSHEAEDFCLARTSAAGKYRHLGTSALHFGRDDGLNECGLSVTMSSCGFPVGPLPYMRAPKIAGLQYWAAVRAVLENCANVQEAINYVKEMPIAFNINLIVADKEGHIALMETLDGRWSVKRLEEYPEEMYLHATNHVVLPELLPYEPQALRHSLIRYDWADKQLNGKTDLTADDLKGILQSEFPEGLTCHYFRDFFGTTKSMVIDPADGTIEICWGGNVQNGWRKYYIEKELENTEAEIEIRIEAFVPKMADFLPITLSSEK